MGKIRVYELARELDLSSNELLAILKDLGLELSSHMNTIDGETAELVVEVLEDQESESTPAAEKEHEKEGNKRAIREAKKGTKKRTKKRDQQQEVKISAPITVKDLAEDLNIASGTLMTELIGIGLMVNINQELDHKTLAKINKKLQLGLKLEDEEDRADEEDKRVSYDFYDDESTEDLKPRPAVVTIMGHVDHGKTSLLDKVRETNVMEEEAGGITQHIGAYQVQLDDRKITFLDTPGHEAFTSMRARGAQVTDIAVLVVAADDGVMPQTVEAINHARAAEIPIIVAINKMDKNNANPDRVKQELSDQGLVPEEWGGKTICVNLSALKGQNIDELLEMINLVAEIEELKANPNRLAQGIIVEAELDRGRGPVATVLVKNGSLQIGQPMVAGETYGRVRAMNNDLGQPVEEAPPGTPVEVLGFSDVPRAGDVLEVLSSDREARNIAQERSSKKREEEMQRSSAVTLDDLYRQIEKGEVQDLNLIIKADVQGSVEALREALLRLGTDEVKVSVVHGGVGAINETDVNLASASSAIIIGFNVRPDTNARGQAEREGVDIRTYRVIYKAIDDVRSALEGLLKPDYKEVVIGSLEVRATFSVPDIGIIAGCYVREGSVNRNANVRLIRDGSVVHEGTISSLKRFKDDVREVAEGYECGLGIENYNNIKDGDRIEVYEIREIKRTL